MVGAVRLTDIAHMSLGVFDAMRQTHQRFLIELEGFPAQRISPWPE
jgi:hypothetical protein